MSDAPLDLSGRVALVTGAGVRVGARIVRVLHQAGLNVVIHYHSSEQPAAALAEALCDARPNSAVIMRANLHDTGAIDQLVHSAHGVWGRLDVLINNASTFYPTPLADVDENNWSDLIGTNLKAPLFAAKAAADYLRANGGCIINITDIHAERPLADHPIYCAAKAGLVALTKALARDLSPTVRVNAIAPGAILWPTDVGDESMAADSRQKVLAKIALGREGDADDIARTALFLIRDAPYITGQNIAVDGGRVLQQ
ncbi:MAG: pteridine reductase [Gammaproteobacteria bacterium]|nr:pteridine reductase [Gammaproteobacteria bacterium]